MKDLKPFPRCCDVLPSSDDDQYRMFSLRELKDWCDSDEGQEIVQFWNRLMITPMDLWERTFRPRSGFIGGESVDEREVNEHSVCGAFSQDVVELLARCIPERGIPITKENLSKLPTKNAVYWLNCPLDAEFKRWRIVYVGKAADLKSRWADHHKADKAIKYKCRLDWWEVEPGTEMLIEAALIYEWKPGWNERQ